MNGLSINFAIILYIIGIFGFLLRSPISSRLHHGKNLIMILISLELILLSIGILLCSISFNLDDLIGTNLTLFILPLAGCESAIGLALLVAYYPFRGSIELQ